MIHHHNLLYSLRLPGIARLRCPEKVRLRLRSKANSRRALALVENGKHGLEKDVPEYGEANASVGLDASVALCLADRPIVNVAARNCEHLAADEHLESWQLCRAAEDISSPRTVVACTRHLIVVSGDNTVGQIEKGCASVSDSVADSTSKEAARSGGPSSGRKLPSAVGSVDRYIRDVTDVSRCIDISANRSASALQFQECNTDPNP